MRSSVADHWWGFEDGHRKMHWRSWSWLSAPKSLGGMGFIDFSPFNQAMLGKQCWRLVTEPSSLCSRVLKGRYFPDTDFLSAEKPRSASFTWRSILFSRELFLRGMSWGIAVLAIESVLASSRTTGFLGIRRGLSNRSHGFPILHVFAFS
jgi:hypothetical protein